MHVCMYVSDETVQNFWISAARQRWVVAFLGGPPCETWSRAREHDLADSCNRCPRVVRTAAQPWGLDSLSLREIRQVLVGNQLMFFAIMMLTILYDTGGCGAMEHPAKPTKRYLSLNMVHTHSGHVTRFGWISSMATGTRPLGSSVCQADYGFDLELAEFWCTDL